MIDEGEKQKVSKKIENYIVKRLAEAFYNKGKGIIPEALRPESKRAFLVGNVDSRSLELGKVMQLVSKDIYIYIYTYICIISYIYKHA